MYIICGKNIKIPELYFISWKVKTKFNLKVMPRIIIIPIESNKIDLIAIFLNNIKFIATH